jgi:hypothetical protein
LKQQESRIELTTRFAAGFRRGTATDGTYMLASRPRRPQCTKRFSGGAADSGARAASAAAGIADLIPLLLEGSCFSARSSHNGRGVSSRLALIGAFANSVNTTAGCHPSG